MEKYELFVIGGGPGGYVAAIRAAQLGMKVALAENTRVGGTCLNRGCIPTKALLHSSHLYDEAKSGEKIGVLTDGLKYDMEKIFARKNEVSEKLVSGVQGLLKANGVDVIEGFATITKANPSGEITVEGTTYEADRILIATGLVPAVPPFPGHDLPGVVTSNDILEGPVLNPESITIIGGSVIGVELATFYAELGIKVTVIEALDQLLPIIDKEFGQKLRVVLKKKGVEIFVKAAVNRIEQNDGKLECFFDSKGKEASVTSDVVLVATGRKPDMKGLFADGIEVATDGRFITVDENFETSIPGIYAIGDIIGGIQLAHVASAEGKTAVEIMAGAVADTCLNVIPSCIYSNPEIATVGLTEEAAQDAGYETISGKYLMAGNGKSIIEDQDMGFIKVISDKSSGKVLGAHLMCQRASDLVGEFVTAIANDMTYQDMMKAIKPHPSFAEGIAEALEAIENRSIHSAPVKKS